IPDIFHIPVVPFQFHIVASATSMTRAEFISQQTSYADVLRSAILKDATASTALTTLAADQSTWEQMYLASLEETGLLLPDGTAPPIRTDPKIISVMATLATGILAGPVGNQVLTTGSLSDFFDNVRKWYGDKPDLLAPNDPNAPHFTSNSLGIFG